MIRKADSGPAQTPMMQQYLLAKERYAEEILFFRMGDFYEMFFEDAHLASDLLGIALTSRSKDKDAIPMAGIPVKALDSYLPKLLRAGKKVAICEQVQDPREAKGLVEREVVRVITPGTITDEKIIGEKSNNYLAALCLASSKATKKKKPIETYGLAWMDVTTGEFLVWESGNLANIATQLERLAPAECLLPESIAFNLEHHPAFGELVRDYLVTPFSDPAFDRKTAHRSLVEHFRTKTLDGFGCEHLDLAVQAGGGLLSYVQETQKVALKHLNTIRAYQETRVVPIDRTTRRALELTSTQRDGEKKGTLLASFDRTATAAGGRKLKAWILEPLTGVEEIIQRQEGVAGLVDDQQVREQGIDLLKQVHDLERICTRISYGSANARDLVALAHTLEIVPRVQELLAPLDAAIIAGISERMPALPELRVRLEEALRDEPPLQLREGGMIREGYSEELDELRVVSTEGSQWFARYQQKESDRTSIPNLKIGYNKVFGYYLEVTNSHKDNVPEDYIRKQTLKNCERYITPELKEYENKVLHARERAIDLEYKIFTSLRDEVANEIPLLQQAAEALAELDVLVTFASLAAERGYIRPVVNNGTRLLIEEGRHPVVERVATTEPFIANSVDLDDENNIMIITGPNMAGKSTYIRQVALLALLAQTGSFIPAEKAEIGVIDRLFTRVGASDDLTRGQSTFMVEMNETANILNNATARSLIILDEVGRGTSTFDGVSLAWAITEYIADRIEARTLFATHYHELTELTRTYPGARNFNFAVKEWNEDIIFLRKIIEGGADKSYGIHVARLAGIPVEVIDRAREVLGNLEQQSLDIDDRPALARSTAKPREGEGRKAESIQLDFFQSINDEIYRELKSLDLDAMTPLEALKRLAELKDKVL
ncbi:MAG: DNA mismatch repair protein MutS [Planctomycetota bacterium]|nr:DNA mismatch repair protein MutS [Planctomycetota bacterium]MEE3295908.1 DNA mismatch repair protein MutS [Planctomycetota bacterium]